MWWMYCTCNQAITEGPPGRKNASSSCSFPLHNLISSDARSVWGYCTRVLVRLNQAHLKALSTAGRESDNLSTSCTQFHNVYGWDSSNHVLYLFRLEWTGYPIGDPFDPRSPSVVHWREEKGSAEVSGRHADGYLKALTGVTSNPNGQA